MVLTRKLTDLFVTGKEIVIEDGLGDPVTVYLRKVTPVDAETAYRAANAARAQALALKTDPDSLLFQAVSQRVESISKEQMVEDLSFIEAENKRLIIQAEVEAEDRWSKDDYLQGLHDAWEAGLKEKHFSEEPDEESERVWAEMQEFQAEVDARMEREKESIKKDLDSMGVQKLKDRYFDNQFERHGDSAWVREYRKQELYFAVRHPDDHSLLAFGDPSEIDAASQKLIQRLQDEYDNLSIDALEGKG